MASSIISIQKTTNVVQGSSSEDSEVIDSKT